MTSSPGQTPTAELSLSATPIPSTAAGIQWSADKTHMTKAGLCFRPKLYSGVYIWTVMWNTHKRTPEICALIVQIFPSGLILSSIIHCFLPISKPSLSLTYAQIAESMKSSFSVEVVFGKRSVWTDLCFIYASYRNYTTLEIPPDTQTQCYNPGPKFAAFVVWRVLKKKVILAFL